MNTNRYADCTTERQVLDQALGTASMCWVERPLGEFDSSEAAKVSDEAWARMQEIRGDG